jgi:hypothetical protein
MAKKEKKEKKIFIIIIIHSPCVVSQYLFGKVSVGWGSSSVPTVLGLFLVEHKCRYSLMKLFPATNKCSVKIWTNCLFSTFLESIFRLCIIV